MPTRVYALLDLVCADIGQVARPLKEKPGVAEVNVLAGACMGHGTLSCDLGHRQGVHGRAYNWPLHVNT